MPFGRPGGSFDLISALLSVRAMDRGDDVLHQLRKGLWLTMSQAELKRMHQLAQGANVLRRYKTLRFHK